MTELFLRVGDWWLGTAVGGGLVMLVGCGLMRLARQPAARQRLGEYAVLAALIVAGLRLLPAWLPAPSFLPSPGFAGVGSGVRAAVLSEEPSPPAPLPQSRERGEVYVYMEPDNAAPADAAPGAAPSSAWTWHYVAALAVAAYLLVAAALASRWLLGQWALGRLLRQARPAAPRVRRLFTAMAAGAVWPLPQLRLSRRLRAPVCFGLRKPAVVLPEQMDDAADTHLRWIFAHELTHLRRRDPWSSWGLGLAQAIYFFLPWFWWVRRQVRLCQEYVADAAAANAGAAADEYAEFLVSLARGTANPLGATGLGSSSDLFRRVQMLLQPSTRVQGNWPRGRTLVAAGGLLTVAILTGGLGLRAEPPKDADKSELRKSIVVTTDGNDSQNADGQLRFVYKLLDDAEEKDGKKTDKKPEKKTVNMTIVIDTGSGPVTIPLDANSDDLKKQIEKAVQKARAEAAAGQKQRQQVVQKALELLKGELSDEQLKQLQRHIEELRAKKGALGAHHEEAIKAWAAADKQAAEAAAGADHAKLQAEEMLKHLEALTVQKMAPQAAAGAYGKGAFMAFAGGGSRLGTHVKKPSADLADQLDLPKDQGLVVVEVVKDSAAAKAGLKTNDIILELAGKPVASDPGAFAGTVRELKADDAVDIIVLRKGHREKINVKLPEVKKDGPPMVWKLIDPSKPQATEGKLIVAPDFNIEGQKKIELRFAPPGGDKKSGGDPRQKTEKKESHTNRNISIQVSNGDFTAKQTDDGLTIVVTGKVDDGKVDVNQITIDDGEGKKTYKRVADVPAEHRDAVKKLISNSNESPVRFNSFKREEK